MASNDSEFPYTLSEYIEVLTRFREENPESGNMPIRIMELTDNNRSPFIPQMELYSQRWTDRCQYYVTI